MRSSCGYVEKLVNWQTSVVEFLKENATPVNILIVLVSILIVVVIVQMWSTARQRRETLVELRPDWSPRTQELWNELSDREREVAQLVAKGKSNKQVARELHISANTVKTHLKTIYEHFGISSRKEVKAIVRQVVTE